MNDMLRGYSRRRAINVAGHWVIEGNLASYFDTVHHRQLLNGVRKRIADQHFLALLWKFIKAGCVDQGLFRAATRNRQARLHVMGRR